MCLQSLYLRRKPSLVICVAVCWQCVAWWFRLCVFLASSSSLFGPMRAGSQNDGPSTGLLWQARQGQPQPIFSAGAVYCRMDPLGARCAHTGMVLHTHTHVHAALRLCSYSRGWPLINRNFSPIYLDAQKLCVKYTWAFEVSCFILVL